MYENLVQSSKSILQLLSHRKGSENSHITPVFHILI